MYKARHLQTQWSRVQSVSSFKFICLLSIWKEWITSLVLTRHHDDWLTISKPYHCHCCTSSAHICAQLTQQVLIQLWGLQTCQLSLLGSREVGRNRFSKPYNTWVTWGSRFACLSWGQVKTRWIRQVLRSLENRNTLTTYSVCKTTNAKVSRLTQHVVPGRLFYLCCFAKPMRKLPRLQPRNVGADVVHWIQNFKEMRLYGF